MANEWASLSDRQKSIPPWVGAAGLRQDSFCKITPGDVARSPANTLTSVVADKLHNQAGRVIKFGCTCHDCPVLHAAAITPAGWCVLHGACRNLQWPASPAEMDTLNKRLSTTGHGWRGALALGLREAVEQGGWCPPIRPIMRRFGWEDARRPASYAVDLAKQQPSDPVRFDKGLRETTGRAVGAPTEWKWSDVAEQTGVAKTTFSTGPSSYKVFQRPKWEGGTASLFGAHVVKAKSTTAPTGWDMNGGTTSANAPAGLAPPEDFEGAAFRDPPLDDEATPLDGDDSFFGDETPPPSCETAHAPARPGRIRSRPSRERSKRGRRLQQQRDTRRTRPGGPGGPQQREGPPAGPRADRPHETRPPGLHRPRRQTQPDRSPTTKPPPAQPVASLATERSGVRPAQVEFDGLVATRSRGEVCPLSESRN